MKYHNLLYMLAIFIAFPLMAANRQGQQKIKPMPRLEHIAPDSYVQGEVIIKMNALRPDALRKGVNGAPSLNAVLSTLVSPRIEPMFKGHTMPPGDPSLVDLSKYFVVRYGGPSDAVAVAKLLMQADDVEFAEPRFKYTTSAPPNDPYYDQQWHLPIIQAEAAWLITQGDSDVVIGIVDTGVDIDHIDLKDNIWHNPGEMGIDALARDKSSNGIDDDCDGYIDDWRGWDLYGQDNDPRPGVAHGTHVAGIAAAVTNNGIGVAGVAPHCKLMAIKTSPDAASDQIFYGYEGIVYAADQGAKVINCSWSGSGFSQAGQDVITYATQKGALVVAAAGNGGADQIGDNIDLTPEYPAAYTGVLAVASTGTSDAISYFSNYGYTVSVSAPGENILSTIPDNFLASYNGTSMASPIVAGVAALVASQNPGWTPLQVGQQVRVSADTINSINPDYAHLMGFGRVNAYRALTIESPAIRMSGYSVNDSATGNNDGIFTPGETIQVDISLTNYLKPSGTVTVSLASASEFITIETNPQQLEPIGTLQTIQLPSFNVKVKTGAPENQLVHCTLTISDGSYTDFGTLSFLVHPTYFDMNINKITMTMTSRGTLAYNDYPSNRQGSGFRFQETGGLDYLFEGAFMMGTDADHVVDAARDGTGNTQIADFEIISNLVIQAPGPIADQQGSGIFNDGLAPRDSALGVQVKYRCFSFTDTTSDDCILLRYDVTNTSSNTLSNFCAGLYLDWDVGTSNNNNTAIDTDLRLAYVYDTAAHTPAAYAGIVMLSQEPLVFRAIDNAATGNKWGVYDGFTKAEKWDALSNGVSVSARGTSDVSMVIGLGPHTLYPGDSVTVPYALLAAMTLPDLKEAAQRALQKWELIRDMNYYEALTPFQFALSQNYPNPFNGGTIIRYILERQSNVTLKVFDLLGREIETLVDRVQSPGSYEANFPQTKTLASGVYFCRLTSGGHTLVRKMVYIR
jgi:subtilisin family serine protease